MERTGTKVVGQTVYVYGIFEWGECIYVGETLGPSTRFRTHHQRYREKGRFVTMKILDKYEDLEHKWILHYQNEGYDLDNTSKSKGRKNPRHYNYNKPTFEIGEELLFPWRVEKRVEMRPIYEKKERTKERKTENRLKREENQKRIQEDKIRVKEENKKREKRSRDLRTTKTLELLKIRSSKVKEVLLQKSRSKKDSEKYNLFDLSGEVLDTSLEKKDLSYVYGIWIPNNKEWKSEIKEGFEVETLQVITRTKVSLLLERSKINQ